MRRIRFPAAKAYPPVLIVVNNRAVKVADICKVDKVRRGDRTIVFPNLVTNSHSVAEFHFRVRIDVLFGGILVAERKRKHDTRNDNRDAENGSNNRYKQRFQFILAIFLIGCDCLSIFICRCAASATFFSVGRHLRSAVLTSNKRFLFPFHLLPILSFV